MPIDPSLILGVRPVPVQAPDSIDRYAKIMNLRNAQDQGDLQGLQLQQAKQGLDDETAVRDIYRQAGGDNARLRALLTEKGLRKPLMELDKFDLESRAKEAAIAKDKATATKSTTDATIARLERGAAIFGTAKDQPSYDSALRYGVMTGVFTPEEVAKMPPQFNPQFISAAQSAGMTRAQQLADERAREQAEENKRHNKQTESNTVRGQNMVDARARETANAGRWVNDLERGLQINMQTGETRPITQDGQPLANKGPKLTEDQGKATGWLVQADNAYKNMMKAIDPAQGGKPSAAAPGLNDVLAAVPSLGATEGLANMMRGEQRQAFLQASSSLSEALLRAATGAGVNASEAAQKVAELTPQIGDGPKVRKQKLDAIPLYLESLKVRAGPGAAQLPGIVERGAPKPATEPVPEKKPRGGLRGILTANPDGTYTYGAGSD